MRRLFFLGEVGVMNLARKIEILSTLHFDRLTSNEDVQIVHTPQLIKRVSPKSNSRFHNGIYHSQLKREDCAETISRVIAEFEELNVPFAWATTPKTEPHDFEDFLLARGFRHEETCLGMTLEVSQFNLCKNDDIKVERVNEKNINDYMKVGEQAWGFSDETQKFIRRRMEFKLRNNIDDVFHYVAYCGGVPAGVSQMSLFSGYAGFFGASVVPVFRGRGVYKALISARIIELLERNIPLAAVHCLENTSAPVCSNLGFKTQCLIKYFYYGN